MRTYKQIYTEYCQWLFEKTKNPDFLYINLIKEAW